MRDYLRVENLCRAFGLAVVVTIMSAPRVLVLGVPPALYIPTTLIAMTIVAGAATAWSRYGALNGLFPRPASAKSAYILAPVLGLTVFPILLFTITPATLETVSSTVPSHLVQSSYPNTFPHCLALILWSAGFELLFFIAAPISLSARLLPRFHFWPGFAAAAALRVLVIILKIPAGTLPHIYLVLLFIYTLTGTAILCRLFTRGGLPPCLIFISLADLHHIVRSLLY